MNSFEVYLPSVTIPKYRIALAKFRCCDHILMTEKGIKIGIARNERLCPLCVIPVIESQYPCCLVCPFYHDLRGNIVPKYLCKYPTLFQQLL